MAAAPVLPLLIADRSTRVGAPRPAWAPRFDTIVSSPALRTRGAMGVVSVIVHSLLLAAVFLVPLLGDGALPEADQVVRAFFVSPVDLAPPPPPPPPPAAGPRPIAVAPAAARPTEPRFVAPVEMPAEIRPEAGLDLGVEGGVQGGVEGGVPGGVVGGIVGGLPDAPAPPPAKVVRVGGHIHAPKQLRRVDPVYPELAKGGRVQGLVVIEAHVGVDGAVKEARVLRGIVLLDQAALEAVRQWRYQPLLLNGEPTEFVLTVTVRFTLVAAE